VWHTPCFHESSAFSLMKFCPYSSMKIHEWYIFLNIHPWNLVDFSNGGKKFKNWNELHLMNEIKVWMIFLEWTLFPPEISSIDFHSFIKINTKENMKFELKTFQFALNMFQSILLASNLKNYLIVLIFLFGWFPNFN
jgi:hypothetical protein